ncbi:MAG: hypothetical protein RL247_312, partial [Actinomycetota bacterium]
MLLTVKKAFREAIRLFAIGIISSVLIVGFGGQSNSGSAHASVTDFMINNEVLRFGGGGHNQTSYSYVDSIADSGMPEQPFYKNASGTWRKLTYSNIPLSMTLGSGTGGSNWSGSNVMTGTDYIGITTLSGLSVDSSGMTTRTPSQSVSYGYGTMVVSGNVTLNGSAVRIQHRYELGQTDSYVKATTTITNTTGSPVDNVVIWVGTRDDWVGDTDGPRKDRGNLVDGVFTPITNTATASSAIKISTSEEAVLFYSTTPGTGTSISSCCSFSNAFSVNPASSPTTLTGDGSYAISLPVGTLAANGSASIVWFYAGGTLAAIDAIVQAVAAAAAPAVPIGVPGDQSVLVSWEQPTSQDPIIGYRLRYTTDNGANYTTHPTDFQGDSTPRELNVTGLTNGTEYKFQVAALTGTNTLTSGAYASATLGTYSNSSLGVIPGAPSAPTLSAVTPGNQKLTVAFTAPSSTGGFAITDYEYSTDNGATWVSAGTTSSPFVISGLTNGTTYQVKLRGKNANHSGVASSATNGTPAATVPGAPSITGISAASQSLSVAFTAPGDNGGSSITNYQYSTDGTNYRALSPAQTTSPIVITTLSSDGTTLLVNGTSYPITIKAVNSTGASAASNSVNSTPNVPAPPSTGGGGPTVTATPPVETTPRVFTRVIQQPGIQQGPILRGNVPPPPPIAPTATLGGRPATIQTQVTSPTGFSLTAGVLNLGVQVQQDQGVVRQNTSGGTEIEVRKGSTAAVTGTGLLPRSTVQVFLPLQGTNAKEIARIPVDEAGSFSGEAIFATRANERPIPIGKQVLQVVSLDEDGNQAVVEMTVNIAQPPPAPEPDRTVGERPSLLPGQFLATNAGEPEVVTVIPVPDVKQARVEGDGWQMAVDIPSSNGGVSESDNGGALLQLVRDETAVVSGSGFMPGTRADVWLFSDPTLLGTVDIDENGEFTGEVAIDANVVVVGEHTLQLQGVGEDGYVRAANLGVVVSDVA